MHRVSLITVGVGARAAPPWGKPDETAESLASRAGTGAGFLNGDDTLNDGGVVASITDRARVADANG